MPTVERAEIESLISDLTSPHVDLSRILGSDIAVLVSVSDLDTVLKSSVPTFHVSIGDVDVSFTNRDHGFMTTLEVKLP